jgi:hypothetical protein
MERGISSKEFIDRLVKCLEKGEDFILRNCIVEGDVDILDIYKRIKEKIKDEEKLKKLIKEKDGEIYVKIDTNINIENVEFKGKFIMKSALPTDYIHENYIASFRYIRTIFDGNLTFNNVIFNKEANFKDVIFNRRVDFKNSKFNTTARFINAMFNKRVESDRGYVGSYYCKFSGTIFEKSCYFDGAIFYGDVEFSTTERRTKFLKKISFNGVKFYGNVEFNAEFGIERDCNNLSIEVDFKNVEFHGKVSFNNSVFNIRAFFEDCNFKGKTYFHSTFKSIVSFNKSIFNKYAEFQCIFESSASFEKTEFNDVNFIKSEFNTNLDGDDEALVDFIFMRTKFKNASFVYTKFNLGVSFYDVKFENVGFYGVKFKTVLFEFCECNGDFVFFNEHPVFKTDDMKTVFKGNLYITYCSFEGIVGFDNAKFEKNVEFIGCKFKRKFVLTNGHILGDFEIQSSEFNNTLISDSLFENRVNFIDLYFEKYAKFSNLEFKKSVKFSESIFRLVEFLDISFNIMVFSEIIFEDIISFKNKNNDCNTGILIFNSISFKNSATFFNISLSKTSFLLTDTKNVTIITNDENENKRILDKRILDELLLKLIIEEKDTINEIREKYHTIKNLKVKIKQIKQINKNDWKFEDEKENEKSKIERVDIEKRLKELKDRIKEEEEELNELTNKIKPKLMDIINNGTDDFYTLFLEIFIDVLLPYLREQTVLKEYRDIRKSFENNRTYVEASELFIYEMDLVRKITVPNYEQYKKFIWIILLSLMAIIIISIWYLSTIILISAGIILILVILCFLEGIIFDIYKITSNYGESITKPIIISLIFVLFVFPILLPNVNLEHLFNSIGLYIYNLAPEPLKNIILHYNELLEQTLRAFFQLGMNEKVINNSKELQTLASYEWLIRIISLILLGSLFIAIKRRLERK